MKMSRKASQQPAMRRSKVRPAHWCSLFAASLLLLFAGSAQARQTAPLQNLTAVKASISEFLHQQSLPITGKVDIKVGHIDQHLRLQQCSALQPFLPAGNRAWGRTTVGVKCSAPSSWTIYVQATVSVSGAYLAAAHPLSQGQIITEQDLMLLTGDLTTLPAGILTEKTAAIGQTVASAMPAGSPLRQDRLRQVAAVKQGQAVRIISAGNGFSVSVKGQALNNAGAGQTVRAKTGNGTVVSGIARQSGEILVSF